MCIIANDNWQYCMLAERCIRLVGLLLNNVICGWLDNPSANVSVAFMLRNSTIDSEYVWALCFGMTFYKL